MPQQGIRRWGGRALLSAGLVAALFTGYKLSQISAQKTITVIINEQAYQLDTDAPTVQSALDQAHIVLDPTDEITPDLTAPVDDGTLITINKAHTVALDINGQISDYRTQLSHPLDILHEYGVPLDQNAIIRVDGRAFAADELHAARWPDPAQHIAVRYAITFTLIDIQPTGRIEVEVETTQADVGRALEALDTLDLYLADRVTPAFSTPITPGLTVEILRSVPVTLTVDGRTLTGRAAGPTVGDALAEMGIALIGEDTVDPAEDTRITPDLAIRVVRITEDLLIERVPVPFATQFQPDAGLPRGTQREIQAGQPGESEQWQRVRYADGQEIARTLIDEHLILSPVSRIVLVGTGSPRKTPDADE